MLEILSCEAREEKPEGGGEVSRARDELCRGVEGTRSTGLPVYSFSRGTPSCGGLDFAFMEQVPGRVWLGRRPTAVRQRFTARRWAERNELYIPERAGVALVQFPFNGPLWQCRLIAVGLRAR